MAVQFRTIPIIADYQWPRGAEVYLGISDNVKPAIRCSVWTPRVREPPSRTQRRRITEAEAAMVVAATDVAAADGKVSEAQAALQQVQDDLRTKRELVKTARPPWRAAIWKRRRKVSRPPPKLRWPPPKPRDAAQQRLDAAAGAKATARAALRQSEIEIERRRSAPASHRAGSNGSRPASGRHGQLGPAFGGAC